jgi:hypothetical protein
MFAGHRRAAAGSPIFLRRPAGAFSVSDRGRFRAGALSQLALRKNPRNTHTQWLEFLLPHKVRVMELILRDRRGAGRLQECSPSSFCKTDRRFTL